MITLKLGKLYGCESVAEVMAAVESMENAGFTDEQIQEILDSREEPGEPKNVVIDVRPKGKWVMDTKYYYNFICSNCKTMIPSVNDYYRAKIKFCPYCGAEMEPVPKNRWGEST